MTLHIYPQDHPHGDCYVLGTVDDLKRLAEALLESCNSGKSKSMAFTSDGEGYSVCISMLSEDQLVRTRLPYVNDFDQDRRKDVTEAWQHFYSDSGTGIVAGSELA